MAVMGQKQYGKKSRGESSMTAQIFMQHIDKTDGGQAKIDGNNEPVSELPPPACATT